MNKSANIEIRVIGKVGELTLNPCNFDLKETIAILQAAEGLLFPTSKKERPIISYSVEEGSVKHLFKTSLQAVIGFQAIMMQVQQKQSLDFLETPTAKSIELLQDLAIKKNYSVEFRTSESDVLLLNVDRSTKYYRLTHEWVQTELYFYGTLTNAGGKNKPNIHIDTTDLGTIIVKTDKSYLAEQNDNLLYKNIGVRALGLQRLDTGEIDKNSFELIELIDYQPKYDATYLNVLINKAAISWKNVTDTDLWINNLRAGL